jgi:hypothetical protein
VHPPLNSTYHRGTVAVVVHTPFTPRGTGTAGLLRVGTWASRLPIDETIPKVHMKRLLALAGLIAAMSLPASAALAASPGTHGQPSQNCQAFFGDAGPFTPAGFNTGGFAHAETVYAGSQPQNSRNPKSVSQYDVACFEAAAR